MAHKNVISIGKVNYQLRSQVIKEALNLIKENSKSLLTLLAAEFVISFFYTALFFGSIFIFFMYVDGTVNSLTLYIGIAMLAITILDLPFAVIRYSIFRIAYLKIISSPKRISVSESLIYSGSKLMVYIKIKMKYYFLILISLPLIKKPTENAFYYSKAEYFYIVENTDYESSFSRSRKYMTNNWVPSLKMEPYRIFVLIVPVCLWIMLAWTNSNINFTFFFSILVFGLMDLVSRIFYLSLNFVIFKKSKKLNTENKLTFSF